MKINRKIKVFFMNDDLLIIAILFCVIKGILDAVKDIPFFERKKRNNEKSA